MGRVKASILRRAWLKQSWEMAMANIEWQLNGEQNVSRREDVMCTGGADAVSARRGFLVVYAIATGVQR